MSFSVLGVCRNAVGEKIPSSVHISKEKQEEEGDGVLFQLHGSEVSSRALELYRHTSTVYTRKCVYLSNMYIHVPVSLCNLICLRMQYFVW